MSDQISEGNALAPIAIRSMRVKAAIECREGDRVPFIPTTNNFNALHYGISIYDVMKDYKFLKPAVMKYLEEYDPDLFYTPAFFPIDPMELAQHASARWPGPYYNLPVNTPYQYVDQEFLGDDDWDEYLRDPSAFLLTKVLPKKFKSYDGLQYISLPAASGHAIFGQAIWGAPPVKKALENMIRTGEMALKYIDDMTELNLSVIQAGYPVFGSAVVGAPFDEFADYVRGLITLCMDIKTDPELVDEAVNRWADVSIPAAVANAKMQHAQYGFIPLHAGVDNFMSVDDYNKHYWPTLKRLICAYVDAGITPVVICEGKYYTRLETLTDIPKGKVIYIFEDVDFAEAKRILGGTACIGGGMPTQYLMSGPKERVVEQTKRMLDICAPGGGFVFSNSLALDDVDRGLMETWQESVLKYGQF
ncbi:uroporphyrinogen decarboxylase family protein [Parasporobacterium paucivorans]|uniref:Uroporphyrinogen decarboxylase (URO-D) n=1 Tax=Parasporobacterium paucivorans DSM 15970 TaxID=1122934 RepID=A0A1M6KF73_9FIRM|nr:uroporphyrinogen decarboxylase family protein [Parasporobacterium paucivorans]SHJ57569.1 Uroporphyrinogen decarboxylase (URO-D) [Parasporobacterium paucivorans DSM 15970]